jgi:hypothetical protein
MCSRSARLDVGTLRTFIRDYLDNAYQHIVLIECNDPRLIDVALVSKLPLGQATSWQHARHKSEPTSLPIFSRDLLEVDVLAPGRTKRLFKVYVNHLKLSTELAKRQIGAFILRRTKLTRYGTDHDPAWVTLDL